MPEFNLYSTRKSLLCGILFFMGCFSDDQQQDVMKGELVFPEALIYLQQKDSLNMLKQLLNKKIKIVTYFKGDCSSCVVHLKEWKNYLDNNYAGDTVITPIFISYVQDPVFLDYQVSKQLQFNYPVFVDKENRFYQLNKLPFESSKHTFIIDEHNNIAFVGTPIDDSERDRHFKNCIDSLKQVYH